LPRRFRSGKPAKLGLEMKEEVENYSHRYIRNDIYWGEAWPQRARISSSVSTRVDCFAAA